jgi:hypothetical protein
MSKVISAEVPDELADQVDATREGEPPDYDESRSQAVKSLIRDGLKYREPGGSVGPWYVVGLLGWLFVAGAFVEVGTTLGLVGMALVIASALEGYLGLLDRLL